jgi:hypothetical protein
LVATFLGVQTGEIDLIPRTTGEDGRVALGSVKVAKTDFVRSSLIGAAPFFVGCSALYALLTIFFSPLFTALNMSNFPGVVPVLVTLTANWQTWLAILLMFIVGNTMFTSKEDAGAFPVLGVMVLITLIGVYVFGQYGWLNTPFAILVRVARALHASFAFVIVLNLMVASLLKLIEIILQRVTGKRVVYGGK